MSDKQYSIYQEFVAERERQDEQWGGPSHDDNHYGSDFLTFIFDQVGKYRNRDFNEFKHLRGANLWSVAQRHARARLVKIGALAMAGIESIDRNQATESSSE